MTKKHPPTQKHPVPKNSSSLTEPPKQVSWETPNGRTARAVPTIIARQIPKFW